METAEAFMENYRVVFERLSAPEIAELFAFPVHVSGDHGAGVTLGVGASKAQWLEQLEVLLAGYRKIGVATAQARSLESTAVSPNLFQAHVRWALADAAGRPLYEFSAAYTLARVGDHLRVVAIAHDELPKLRSALSKGGA
jgi:hypothetical protein